MMAFCNSIGSLASLGEVDTNNISIIDRAERPGAPDSPSLRFNLMIAFALGLFGAAAVAGVREVLDDTFKAAEDIEEVLRIPVLGLAPAVAQAKAQRTVFEEVTTDFTSPISEAYRSLRTALQFSTEEGVPKTLLVTSARPGEGKSTAAACLAVNFAQLGMRVLLIDGDLRNPSMHTVLGVENNAGLTNYLAGANEASELVQAEWNRRAHAADVRPTAAQSRRAAWPVLASQPCSRQRLRASTSSSWTALRSWGLPTHRLLRVWLAEPCSSLRLAGRGAPSCKTR